MSVLGDHGSFFPTDCAQKEPGEAKPAAPGWVISPWKEHTAVPSFLGLSQSPRRGVRHSARRTAAGLALSRSLHHW